MKKTAIDIIKKIMVKIEQPHPARDSMLEDIQMMRFKIRPIVGDIASLSSMDKQIVEMLWKIGKIDEIVHASFHELNEDDQDKLLQYLENIEVKAQEDIKHLLKTVPAGKKRNLLKVEIFKDSEDEALLN